MDSSLAEQLVEAYPRIQFALPFACCDLSLRRSAGVSECSRCAPRSRIVALGHAPAKPVGRVEDSTLLPPRAPADARPDAADCPRRSAGRAARDVRRQSGAVPGHRPAARGVPGHACGGCRARTWSSSAARGGHPALPEDRRSPRHRVAVHFLGPRPVQPRCPTSLRQADVLVSPRLKGLNTPMKIYSYLDSGTAVLATRLRTHTQVLDDRTAYLVEPEPEPLGNRAGHPAGRQGAAPTAGRATPRSTSRRSSRPRRPGGSSASFYDDMEARVAGAKA